MPAPRRSISLAALVIPPLVLVASVAVLVLGIAMTIAENDALVSSLNSPDATAADVYGGQSRIVVAAAVLVAGIVAVVVSLATIAVTGSIRAFAPRLGVETVGTVVDDHDHDHDADDEAYDEHASDEAHAAERAADDPADDDRDDRDGSRQPAEPTGDAVTSVRP
ncbi:hypothetical protein GCM10009819_17150 [Agromyces tropicus]|uniref:Dinucleotide-utilizing enzyme n=1 Tax=Agromyces tropicus TaxID=555371 RepID=A0ABP5FTS9_9MICO